MSSVTGASASAPTFAFRYEAQTADGKTLRGTLEGPTAAHVNAQLAALSLRVLVVEPASETEVRRRPALGPDDFLIFNQQLANLTAAGLPVERGLRLIAADVRSGRLASAARDVATDLERGVPLDRAFAQHASRFPPLYGKLVGAGVKAGNLPGMLFNLGHHLELVSKLRQSLWRTLAYPVMVLFAMSLVFLFISLVVLPQFREIFHDFKTTLPLMTEYILELGDVYPKVFTAGVLGVVALLIVGYVARASRKAGLLSDLFLWIPVIGPVLRASLLARWIDALRLSIDAGLDLPQAVDLASAATASPRMTVEGAALADLLVTGRPSELFTGRLIPQTVPASIELASRAGSTPGGNSTELQSTLATLSRMYQQQAEHRLRIVPVIITPLALVVIGSSVMFIVVAMFLPLVRLVQSVSGGG